VREKGRKREREKRRREGKEEEEVWFVKKHCTLENQDHCVPW
jgi:hypothetical protein